MVAVFMPGLKSTPSAASPDHQSHAALPGLIHEVSAIAHGGLRLMTILDSTSRPGLSATIITRHGECNGAGPTTETPGMSKRGDNRATSARELCWSACRYMPA